MLGTPDHWRHVESDARIVQDHLAAVNAVVDQGWFTPQGALDAHAGGDILLVFPTIKHLEQFSAFPTADALVAHAATHEVIPVQPRIVLSGETARVLLPGDDGYDAAP